MYEWLEEGMQLFVLIHAVEDVGTYNSDPVNQLQSLLWVQNSSGGPMGYHQDMACEPILQNLKHNCTLLCIHIQWCSVIL